jgi:transcriptional regulator with XRE-family HTH domain
MQSLGSKLRKEREQRQLTLSGIAEETRISQRYLEAIEADHQSAFPGEFFYRAFVRQYAKFLGLNPDEVEKQINLVSSPPAPPVTEADAAGSPSLNLNADHQMAALRATLKDKPMRPPQDDGTSKSWLAFAFLVMVGCGIYFGWRNLGWFQNAGAGVQATRSELPPPVVEPPPGAPAAPATVASPSAAAAVEAKTVPVRAEAGKFTLTVRAREMTWIRLIADGARVHGGPLDPGQERTISASYAELLVGNAGTLDVIYNGQALAYGNRGEVKTLLVSPEGWKFKPKPQAPEPSPSTEGGVSPSLPASGALE